ncbi:MAG: CoA ester lyase [Rhizobiaceae bacterium]
MVFMYSGWRPRRSVLFMPASNQRAIAKAADLGCDALIFDLEDSVAAGEADMARSNLLKLVGKRDFGRREHIIRTSVPGSSGFKADLAVVRAVKPDAVLLPKLDDATTLAAVRAQLGRHGPRLWAMIESPRALLNLQAITAAASSCGLDTLVIGPNDLARSTGVAMHPGRAAMIPWFMNAMAAARAHDLCILDGVYNNFRDLDGFAVECRQGAELGFDGKTLIHPAQIEAANRAFAPQPSDIDRARRIIEAFELPENASRGAISLDGEMIERLHLSMATSLLDLVENLER